MAAAGALLAVLLDAALRSFATPSPLGRVLLPEIPFLLCVWLGLEARGTRALGWAVLVGLLQDGFSEWPLGHFAFLYGAAAHVGHRMRRYFASSSPVLAAVAALFCGLVHAFLGLALAVASRAGGGAGGGFGPALLSALAGALAAPFLFPLFAKSGLFRRALGRDGYRFAP